MTVKRNKDGNFEIYDRAGSKVGGAYTDFKEAKRVRNRNAVDGAYDIDTDPANDDTPDEAAGAVKKKPSKFMQFIKGRKAKGFPTDG